MLHKANKEEAFMQVLNHIYGGGWSLDACNRDSSKLVHVVTNPHILNKITDFDLYCFAVILRQHGMVIVLDEVSDIWVGDEDEIRGDSYFTQLDNKIVKVY